jgi:hypothetical protein
MRCNICDSDLSKPVFNRQLNTWEPCTTCLDVIFNVFEDYPTVEETPEEDEEDQLLTESA